MRLEPTLAAAVLALAAAALAPMAAAQPLTGALCPYIAEADWEATLEPFGLTDATQATGIGHIPLLKHTINPQTYPNARCNDGSSAVMYIRPANAAYGANPITKPSRRWLIFFEGGGGCRDADSCLGRWCSEGPRQFDRAAKMSSLGTWPAIRSPNGIFNTNPALNNAFADYNHVYVYYCSSDNGIGSARLTGISTADGRSYDIEFQGEAIVNAVFDTLLTGPTAADPEPAQKYYATPLPDLRKATEILIAGESAGGGIVRHHIDRLREDLLEPEIPGVIVRGLVDAGAPPGQWWPSLDWSDSYSPGDYGQMLLTVREPTVRSFWGADDTALDQSCLDPLYAVDHEAIGGHPQVCYDTTYTLLNHITTPLFLRMDIDDSLGMERYANWQLFASVEDYWTTLFNQLTLFSTYPLPPFGPPPLEPPLDAPGVFGPNCDRHVATTSGQGFFNSTVSGIAGALSFHDLLLNWLNGLAPGSDTIQIQTDTSANPVVYTPSNC